MPLKLWYAKNSADVKTNNALSFRHTASSTLQLVVAPIANKFPKGSTNDKTVYDDTDVVNNKDKMVTVEDIVTVKMQNTFNESFKFEPTTAHMHQAKSKFIGESISKRAHIAPIIVFDKSSHFIISSYSTGGKSKAESYFCKGQQQIPVIQIKTRNTFRRVVHEHKCLKSNNPSPFGGKPNKSINTKSASRTFQLVVMLIWIVSPEGVQAPSNIQFYFCVDFVVSIIISNFEEASMLLVGYHYSRISLPF